MEEERIECVKIRLEMSDGFLPPSPLQPPLRKSPHPIVKPRLTIWAQSDSRRLPNARTGMLGHLVSVSRQSPPDFGMLALLRKATRGLHPLLQRLLAPLADALHHTRKEPHPQ